MRTSTFVAFAFVLPLVPVSGLRAQSAGASSAATEAPAEALADALSAACRHDANTFGASLTDANTAEFRQLSEEQRSALMKRMVLLEDPGKPLLSRTADNHDVIECSAGGDNSEMRFGPTNLEDNLAFIPVEIPQAAPEARSVRIGLVLERGKWKLMSVGLLLLDVHSLAQDWVEDALIARENDAIMAMHQIAEALKEYQSAVGRLPEGLDQLGPAGTDGVSPDHAGLLNQQLASGETPDYRFRYVIVPATGEGDESERAKDSSFELGATPSEYGRTGRRSFYLDSAGVLHGADKGGAVATSTDPRVPEPTEP